MVQDRGWQGDAGASSLGDMGWCPGVLSPVRTGTGTTRMAQEDRVPVLSPGWVIGQLFDRK